MGLGDPREMYGTPHLIVHESQAGMVYLLEDAGVWDQRLWWSPQRVHRTREGHTWVVIASGTHDDEDLVVVQQLPAEDDGDRVFWPLVRAHRYVYGGCAEPLLQYAYDSLRRQGLGPAQAAVVAEAVSR